MKNALFVAVVEGILKRLLDLKVKSNQIICCLLHSLKNVVTNPLFFFLNDKYPDISLGFLLLL